MPATRAGRGGGNLPNLLGLIKQIEAKRNCLLKPHQHQHGRDQEDDENGHDNQRALGARRGRHSDATVQPPPASRSALRLRPPFTKPFRHRSSYPRCNRSDPVVRRPINVPARCRYASDTTKSSVLNRQIDTSRQTRRPLSQAGISSGHLKRASQAGSPATGLPPSDANSAVTSAIAASAASTSTPLATIATPAPVSR